MEGTRTVLEWDEIDVHSWLASKGFPQYENQIKQHRISGDILCLLDSDGLKGLGVHTIGQRLAILKAVYQLKVASGVEIAADDYVPPSEASDRAETVSLEKLHSLVIDQGNRLRQLEEDNRNLNETLRTALDELNQLRSGPGKTDDNSLKRQPSFKWAQYVKPAKSPTKADIESPHPSPQQLEHDIPQTRQGYSAPSSSSRPPAESQSPSPSQATPKPQQKQETGDNFRSFKVSLEDPTWKVLPAALKKYRINNDTWQNYAMFICYGAPGNRVERCLSYDEKPLLLFQKLKDAKKNPVFMLKHIKDIRSPIAVAQQKHAARKASSIMTTDTSITTATQGHNKSASRVLNRPPKLEVQDLSTPTAALTGVNPHLGWPEPGVMSPSVEHRDELGLPSSTPSGPLSANPSSAISNGHDRLREAASTEFGDHGNQSFHSKEATIAGGVSYAVAIYPYMAEHEDEFDVVVGDTFVILSRRRGWWIVQRDPNGTGVIETDISKQGWVPAGCLLETNVPVASAIAEATAAKTGPNSTPPQTPASKTPILPLSIISTSFPGIALMDYKKKGEEELDLAKDDALRVFKKYNHWSYAVKEDGGDRGWVPSWFIGKVATPGAVPATPSTSAPNHLHSGVMDDPNQSQVSPMSSAFPVHTRSTPVL
ncbi:hypothetical protein BDN72DRAFT_600023 [Pluteus cervinus]|uniref:Uncharacterized protein n=1 Tax=Pluteus cervinus TaxID=181527 RepID=A0ACD3B9D6_9AGAR|nr:hypothetical protein BDN72DRAFT_600023 [Pluteus cervinus]